ncbi:MFS transporter [Sorangium sp. So ce281]|uniref:MFS transporter n=1 Tax=unclassified Sorangium TaxID=2621164 RepID=UPI003F602D46
MNVQGQRRWLAFLFISVSVLIISFDNTILNVALPSISRALHASAGDLQWIVDAYILVFAALLLTMGAISDRIGRKRMLQIGLILFAIGAGMVTLVDSTRALIGLRACLGVAAAMIMPSTLSIIAATFRDARERAKAIALWAAVFGLGISIGPILGGWLLKHFDWSSTFLVNVPMVVIALVGGHFYIEESRDSHVRQLDLLGVVLSIVGLFALVFAIILAGMVGWTEPTVVKSFGVAVVVLTLFGIWQWRAPHAMLPLTFFRNRWFSGANLALIIIFFANYGSVFFLSQFFQSVRGHTPLGAGLLLLPIALVVTVGSAMSARLAGRFGSRVTVGGGMLVGGFGLLGMSIFASSTVSYAILFSVLTMFAFGLGLVVPASSNLVMSSVPVDKLGVGSGMNDTTRQLGGAFGVAVLGTIANHVYIEQLAPLRQRPDFQVLPARVLDLTMSSIQEAHVAVSELASPLAAELNQRATEAFVAGMTSAMRVGAILFIAGALAVLAILPNGAPDGERHGE